MSEHLFFIRFVGQDMLQFLGYFLYGKIIGQAFFDHFFAGNDINRREIADRENQRLSPTKPSQ